MSAPRPIQTVAIVGDANLDPGDPRVRLARECGDRIMHLGYTLVTGGRGGVMAAASEGARASSDWVPGRIIAIIPGHDPAAANSHADVVFPTGLAHGRNTLVAQCDAVVAIGGGAGTLSEIALAWCHHRLVIGLRCEGWSGRLADTAVDARIRYPDIADDCVRGADDAEDVARLLARWLPMYSRRSGGVG